MNYNDPSSSSSSHACPHSDALQQNIHAVYFNMYFLL